MRKLVLRMSMTADGFVCGPNGENDWFLRTRDPLGGQWVEKTIKEAGVHIMGSHAFRDMSSFWPTSTLPMAAPMNEIPKIVFSSKGSVEKINPDLKTQAPSKSLESWTNA